jgi:hypothetical protein
MSSIQQIVKSTVLKSIAMSIYVPHIDASYTFDVIAHQFENVFEIGTVDRIEAVPKVNQKDGHAYYACFIYFSKWGNGYNAQYVRNQLMKDEQVRMYYLMDRYWMVCANTSEVANYPMPENCALSVYMPWDFVQNECIGSNAGNYDITNLFSSIEVGSVSPGSWDYDASMMESKDAREIIGEEDFGNAFPMHIEFDYWYHSANAHEFQKNIEDYGHVIIYPEIEGYPNMQWLVMKSNQNSSSGINPYIWYSDPSKYQTQNKHQTFMA